MDQNATGYAADDVVADRLGDPALHEALHQALHEESLRQAALDDYAILDTLGETAYDDITKLAAAICGTPIAMITFIDHERQWAKSVFGTIERMLPRTTAFCSHAIQTPDVVTLVPDATADPRFADNPLVTRFPNVRFYAGAPLVTPGGKALGTICVVDQKSHVLTETQVEALAVLSRQVMAQLELRRMNAALAAANDRLAMLSMTDGLTGLANRRAFNRRIDEEVARAERTGDPLSLLMFDIDHFKKYNDRFGHLAGDAALHRVGEIILATARHYDFAARYGGEEFGFILSKTTREGALRMAERLCLAIAEGTASPPSALPSPVTVSIGAAAHRAGGSVGDLIGVADKALYEAKAAGRNRASGGV